MKFFVVALCLIVSAAAAPMSSDAVVAARRRLPALDHEEIHDEYGQYAFRYMTAEGTIISERGRLVPTPDGTGYVMVVEGQVSYIGDDGQVYITKYTAGPDGTHVEGNHLPVNPDPPVEVVEPVNVVAEPVSVVAEPVNVVAEPVNVVSEPVEVVIEPVKVVTEPVKVIVEPAY